MNKWYLFFFLCFPVTATALDYGQIVNGVKQSGFVIGDGLDLSGAQPRLPQGGRDSFEALEFRMVHPGYYVVQIHGLRAPLPLALSESFHRKWRLVPLPALEGQGPEEVDWQAYRTSGGGLSGQASREELRQMLENRWLSGLSGEAEFVSKNYFQSIQNENLPAPWLWSLLTRPALAEVHHRPINGYANAWILDPGHLQLAFSDLLRENPRGGFDVRFALMFETERNFLIGLLVSVSTLLISSGVLIWRYWCKEANIRKVPRVGKKNGVL